MSKENISESKWNESATRAMDPAQFPTMISRKKNMTVRVVKIPIRVDLDKHPILQRMDYITESLVGVEMFTNF